MARNFTKCPQKISNTDNMVETTTDKYAEPKINSGPNQCHYERSGHEKFVIETDRRKERIFERIYMLHQPPKFLGVAGGLKWQSAQAFSPTCEPGTPSLAELTTVRPHIA